MSDTPLTDAALESSLYSYEDWNGQDVVGYDIGVFKGKMQDLERVLTAEKEKHQRIEQLSSDRIAALEARLKAKDQYISNMLCEGGYS